MTVLARIDDLLHVGPISDEVGELYAFLVHGTPVPTAETVSDALAELSRDADLGPDALIVVGEAEFARRALAAQADLAKLSLASALVPGATLNEANDYSGTRIQDFSGRSAIIPLVSAETITAVAAAAIESGQVVKVIGFDTSGETLVKPTIYEAASILVDRFAGQLTEADLTPATLKELEASYTTDPAQVATTTQAEPTQVAETTQETI